MKIWIGIVALLSLFITTKVEAKEAWNVVEIGTKYGFMVNGLKQFPFQRYQDYKYATFIGLNRHCDAKPEYAGSECITLDLITYDDERVSVEVEAGEFDIALFLNELSSNFGKYKWWDAVLQIQLKPIFGEEKYHVIDFELLGRFKIIWDKNNKVVGYTNEVY